MLFLVVLLALHVADASIQLQHSILYDEVDFEGVEQITTEMCATGCKVYATISGSPDSAEIARQITIVDPNTQERTSVFDLSKLYMQDSHEKAYLEFGAAPTVTILNTNANQTSAPLALWIVSVNAPYFRAAEVFEPLNLNRTESEAFAPITILSAYPFTVTVAPGDGNGVFARAAGYDTIDRNSQDECLVAMDHDFGQPFPGLTLTINGPLLTLSFNTQKYPRSQVNLTGRSVQRADFEITMLPGQPTFLSSSGLMCGGASHQVFRSSMIIKDMDYALRTPDDKETKFNFEMDMDTNDDDPVQVYDFRTTLYQNFTGNLHDKTSKANGYLQTNKAAVSFKTEGDNFYGMRVWTEGVGGDGAKTTTTSGMETAVPYTGSTASGNETDWTTSSTNYRSIPSVIVLVIVAVIFE